MKGSSAKKIFIFSLMILGVFFVMSFADAQVTIDAALGQSGLATVSLSVMVARIISAALGLLGLVAVIIVLYGGYLYMTARGDAEKVQKAKKLLIQGVIGLLIIASAFAISSYILYALTKGVGPSGDNINTEPCPVAGCVPVVPPTVTSCTNPSGATSDTPYVCRVNPIQQGKGGVLTIRGGNFGDYVDAATSKVTLEKGGISYTAEVAVCPGENAPSPRWNLKKANKDGVLVPDGIIKVIVPADLTFVAGGSNQFKVYVTNTISNTVKTSIDNPITGAAKNVFTLTDKVPSPEIICLVHDFGNENPPAPVNVYGTNLGSSSNNKLIFNNNKPATISSWTPNLIQTTVPPGAIYGEVYIAENTEAAKKISDGNDFWVTCASSCASGCCHIVSSYSDTVKVCDSSTQCQAQNEVRPVISGVTPNNGASGNYITITGKGFGNSGFGNNLIANPGFDVSGTPWITNNSTATKISGDTSFSGSKSLLIDLSGQTAYYKFYYPLRPLLTANKSYVLSFKLKGLVDKATGIRINAEFGDLASSPKPCRTDVWPKQGDCPKDPTRCCKYIINNNPTQTETYQENTLFTIPAGNYQDWQTFSGYFTFDSAMQKWVANNSYSVNLGMTFTPDTAPSKIFKIYLDDFEVKEISAIGKVEFCGTDCGDGNVTAKFPYEVNNFCSVESSWQNNEILVVAPVGGATGPIKVTTASDLSVQTDPAAAPNSPDSTHSYLIPDFVYNSTKRPGLCGILPNQAAFSSLVRASGTGFGATKGNIYIGNIASDVQFDAKSAWNWTDQTISSLTVPNLKPATLPIRVKVGTELSNPVSFKIIASADQPIIESIDPKQGPTGQYITILGGGFGKVAGKVKFWKLGATDANAIVTTVPQPWVSGDDIFSAACANQYWSDTQIIIKVPGGAENKGVAPFSPGSLIVITANKLQSNIIDFNHCVKNDDTCPLTPGICAIVPNKAPAGYKNIVIWGDNFGSVQGSGNVTFFNNKPVSSIKSTAWAKQKIGVTGTSVTSTDVDIQIPELAVSGPVTVKDAGGISSNRYNFEVADCRVNPDVCTDDTSPCCQQTGACTSTCASATEILCEYKYKFTTASRTSVLGAPTVVELHDCTIDSDQSPSPWKRPDNIADYASRDYACINSMIYARFNMDMNTTTFAGNIIVKKCDVAPAGNPLVCATTTAPVSLGAVNIIETNAFSVAPAVNTKFDSSSWYQVTLKDNITSAGGKKLDGDNFEGAGGDYIWYFRTGDSAEDCQVDTVSVTPNKANLKLITQTQKYNGFARANNCNILNSNAFIWNWYLVGSPGIAQLSDIKDLQGSVIKGLQLATPLAQGTVNVAAKVDNKFDDSNILTISLNIPVITGFTPKDGLIKAEVNSYVDISGTNFGASQGSSKVYFEKAGTSCLPGNSDNNCWVEAKLANCGQAWTNTSVKVIVPKDAKNGDGGAWIKIVTPFGEDNTDGIMSSPRVKNNLKVIGETFNFTVGQNIYPFICQLSPSVGSTGINVALIGDNLGDKNKTIFKTLEFDVGSFIHFNPFKTPILESGKIKNWSNTKINYTNPLTDLAASPVKVFITIDPYSEPFIDTNGNGIYDSGEIFADTINDGVNKDVYNKFPYTVNGSPAVNLESNQVDFNQPPVITSISPDNGPSKQWVTIKGRNFGTYGVNSKVYFVINADDTLPPATLAPCAVSWTGSYIIAVVPEGLSLTNPYFVYITTQGGIDSNKDKKFIVNTKPVGAGLCSLYDLATSALKETGQAGDLIGVTGVRFDASQGDSPDSIYPNNLVFSKNLSAAITSWSETDIKTKIPDQTVSGEVTVIKKMDTGERKCAGSVIAGWCVNGKYDTVYLDVPSNSLPLSINKENYCSDDSVCKKFVPITGTNPPFYPRCPDSTCVDNRCTPDIIGNMSPTSGPVGQWVDIQGCYLGCKRGIVNFTGASGSVVSALFPSDVNGTCGNTWSCSADLAIAYDQVRVEVPNKTLPANTADDAQIGINNVTLKTSYNAEVAVGTFVGTFKVNADTSGLSAQFCSNCGNGTVEAEEDCDKTAANPFNPIPSCDYYGYPTPPGCDIECNNKCQTMVCDAGGANCELGEDLLCGNNVINGTCSDKTITTGKQDCLAGNKTWINGICSVATIKNKTDCLAGNKTWKGEQCDTDLVGAALLGGATCTNIGAGTGTLGCKSNCKFDYTNCSNAPDTTPPEVESTLPVNGQGDTVNPAFCRNGIVDIYFNELIDPATINQTNFVLGSCTGADLVKNDDLINKSLAYIKNILFKLVGYETQALAGSPLTCDDFTSFKTGDYTVTYSNIIDPGANSTSTIDDIPKTVVYLELVEKDTLPDILAAGKTFLVKISSAVKDKAGNQLKTSNTPLTVTSGGTAFAGYAFKFTTAGNPAIAGSGICDIDTLTIDVYHKDYILDTGRLAEEYVNGIKNDPDLFRCAGKNDCALPEVLTTPADYDQDRKTGGNQHIYKANAISAVNTGSFHLSMYAQWSRSDQSDPARMLTISNKFEDTNSDNNLVKNKTGVVYATINPIADKENTGLLVVEAQARGSQKDPVYRIFKIDYLGCSYPWRFDLDSYGNAKTWYCRDTGGQYHCLGGTNDGKSCTVQTALEDCGAELNCQLSLPPAGRIGPQ